LEIEQALVERYHWSLFDLDQTDIESLIPFVMHVARNSKGERRQKLQQQFCDQVSWL
jgi:hypothetical protein